MAKILVLFEQNWNKDGGVFIDFKTITKEDWYDLIMASVISPIWVDMDNYRVDDGVISVAHLSEQTAGKVAYAIEVDTDKKNGEFSYWRCYHVNACRFVSGYAMFSCSVDLWGTYFSQATLSNLRVLRSNMNLGNGTYDKIDYTHTYTTLTDEYYAPVSGMSLYNLDDEGHPYMLDQNAYLIFTANCVVSDTSVSDETSSISAYYIFGNSLKAIRESYPTALQTAYSSVELASRMISGVVGLPTGSTSWKMRKCEITHVYIVPASWAELESGSMNFSYKTPMNQNLTSMTFYYCKPLWFKKAVQTGALLNDPNYKWTLGTIDDGLEVARTTDYGYAYYDVTLNYDGLSVLVKQGTQSVDISKHFELSLVGKSQEADGQTKIVNILSQLLNVVGGAFKAAGSKDPLGSAVNLVTSSVASSLQKAVAKAEPSGSVSSADGYITYDYGEPDKVNYPFMWCFYKSARDEHQRARLYGAAFDVTFKEWSDIMSYKRQIFFLPSVSAPKIAYVMCDCMVTGVNDEAAKFIESKLRSGVYLYTTEIDDISGIV